MATSGNVTQIRTTSTSFLPATAGSAKVELLNNVVRPSEDASGTAASDSSSTYSMTTFTTPASTTVTTVVTTAAAKSASISGGAIAAIVIGVIIAILLLVVGLFLFYRYVKEKRKNHGEYRPHEEEEEHAKHLPYLAPPNIEGLI